MVISLQWMTILEYVVRGSKNPHWKQKISLGWNSMKQREILTCQLQLLIMLIISPNVESFHSSFHINSLRPSDAIWQHRSGSGNIGSGNGLLPVWHQAITWTNVDSTSVKSCGTQLMALSLEDLKIPISKTRVKTTFLKLHPDFPGPMG